MAKRSSKNEVLEANIAFHTALADTYDREQPHYRPENKALVSARLARLAAVAGSQTLVDLGCGTGFVIGLALPHFQRVLGLDVTPSMLAKIERGAAPMGLLRADTEAIPLRSSVANVVTANSFLHHLYDVRPTLTEAYRLLRAGGVFYSEEDPNAFFWQAITSLRDVGYERRRALSDILTRELGAVLHADGTIEASKGVSAEVVQLAEYQKMKRGGMQPDELEALLREVGFSRVSIEYYWFLGQGKVMHDQSMAAADEVERYLRSALPLSRHLFKYLRVEAWK